jgi:hypothetical protein
MRQSLNVLVFAGLLAATLPYTSGLRAAEKPVTREEIALGEKQYGPTSSNKAACTRWIRP